MPYSIMLWLVNPGGQAHEREALEMLEHHRSAFPGAHGGTTEPPAASRLAYGLFDDMREAKQSLESLSKHMSKNEPIKVHLSNGSTFLVPISRVHYAVMFEVERPIDQPERVLESAFLR